MKFKSLATADTVAVTSAIVSSLGSHGAHSGSKQQGFTKFEALVLVLLAGMLGFAGWHALRGNSAVAKEYSALNHASAYDTDSTLVNSFYTCVDRQRGFEPGVPQTCKYGDKVYERPAGYTADNVRNFDHLPVDAQPTVAAIAKKNFMICHNDPNTLSVTKVLNVLEGYIYLSTGCDGGYAAVMVRQGLSWKEVNLGQGGLGCDIARQYQIPKALVYSKAQAGSDLCFTEEGEALPLES